MALIVLRHTAPLVAPGICYGAMDVAVDAKEVAACAAAFAGAHARPKRLWHSPKQRCAHLAQALQALWADVPMQADADLAEMDFGRWEGQTWDGIGASAMDHWLADFATHRPGDGECVRDFLLRVHRALLRVAPLDGDTVWITHAGVIRAVAWWLNASADPSRAQSIQGHDWPKKTVDFGSWHTWTFPKDWQAFVASVAAG